MKRVNKYLFATVTILFLFILGACSSGASTSSEGDDDAEATGGTGEEEKVYKLTMNSQLTPSVEGTPSHHGTVEFIERVAERTNGQVEIEVFYSNQLAGQSESLDALARGTIDFQVTSPVSWADRIPDIEGAVLPYAFQGEDFLNHLVRETEFGELYSEALEEYGVKQLHFFHTSASGYLTNKPIAKKEDFSGVVHSAPSSNASEYYSALGAGVASVSFADYYEALLRGTIDGVTFPYYSLETYKLHEVVDYITIPGEVDSSINSIVVSLKAWDQIPGDLQDIIYEVAMEIEQETMEISKEYTRNGIQFAKDNDIEVIELAEEDYKELREFSKEKYWANYANQNERTEKMVDILIETIEEFEQSGTQSYDEYLDNYR